MKKIYVSIMALSIAAGVNAQSIKKTNYPAAGKNKTVSFEKQKSTSIAQEKGAPIWSDDFSTPSNWSFSNTSSPTYDWSIVTDANLIPQPALRPANFTSVNNGYALVDSDTQGSGNTQNCDITLTVPFSTLGNPNVSIVFENSYRTFQDTRIVQVSSDAGATWTDFVVTDGTEPTAVNTANPQITNLNISSAAGNKAAVLIRFHYEAAWGWFWAIDNVSVNITDDHDLKALEALSGVDGAFGVRMPYSQTPTSQVQPIFFSGRTQNIGANAETDVVYTATIAAASYSGVSSAYSLTPNQIDTLVIPTTFTPPASIASYTLVSGVSSATNTINEIDVANNAMTAKTIAVTANTYARDNGTIASGLYNSGQQFEVGNVFDIFTEDLLYGADIVIGTNAVTDAVMFASLWEIDADGNLVNQIRSTDRIIAAGEQGTKVTLMFDAPITLLADTPYLLTAGSDGGAGDDVIIATSGQSPAQTSLFLDETATWGYVTSTPMIRMNFDASLGLKQLENKVGMNIYPNPSHGNSTLTFNLENQSNIFISVTDLTGKVALTNEMGSLNSGSHKLSLNTEALSNGVYFVNINSNGVTSSQKLVVRK